MKKFLLFLALLMVGPKLAWTAATATPTATLTATPVFVLNSALSRQIWYPTDCYQNDGTAIGTAPLPGGVAWISFTAHVGGPVNQQCFVLSTGSASVRFAWIVPNDFEGQPRLFGRGLNSTLTNTVQVVVNADVIKLNKLTSTATAYLDTTTNVQTQYIQPLQDTKLSRFYMPTNAAFLTRSAGANPIAPGDLVNFQVLRTGTSGNLMMFAIEVEYNAIQGRKP